MNSEAPNLVPTLKELSALLRTCDENHWASEIERDITLLEKGDGYGAHRFLGHIGSMGSLNDLQLSERRDHDRFQELCSQAYELAQTIVRDAT